MPVFTTILVAKPRACPPIPVRVSNLGSTVVFFTSLRRIGILRAILAFSDVLLKRGLLLGPLVIVSLVSGPTYKADLYSVPPQLPVGGGSTSFLLFFVCPTVTDTKFVYPTIPPPTDGAFVVFLPFF